MTITEETSTLTNAADIVRELATSMPEPTAPASPIPPPEPVASVPPQSGIPRPAVKTDVLGRAFDPARFAADAAGNPKTDKLGRFFSRMLGRGRAAAAKEPARFASFIPREGSTPPPTPENAPNAPQTAKLESGPILEVPDKYALLADVYTRAALAGAMGVLGDEWEPDNEAEYRGLRDSVAAYLRAKQKEDLSPGWALALAGLTYGARRLPRPKTQTRIAVLRERVMGWWRGQAVARAVAAQPAPGGAT